MDAIHSTHMGNAQFQDMGGSCESCHIIQKDGEMPLWDRAKYEVLAGITDVDKEEAGATFTWDQDVITDHDDMWFKSTRHTASDWTYLDQNVSDDIFNNWTVRVSGDVDNPFEMTIPELIENFESESRLYKDQCVATGIGDPLIFQTKATGVRVDDIIEYAKPQDGVNVVSIIGDDGLAANLKRDTVTTDNGILAYQFNDETIYPELGYPLRFMSSTLGSGNHIKAVIDIVIEKGSEDETFEVFGFESIPNIGVLSAIDGQIFKAGEPIHLEGYTDAFNETITKVEFSFDRGETWQEYPIDNATNQQWVYWNLDLGEQFSEPGSYAIKMRATSVADDGTEHVSKFDKGFLFNVKEDAGNE